MTTVYEETYENKETYMELGQEQMKKWRDGLEKLGDEISKFPQEVQAAYRREIGGLRSDLEQVESAFQDMDQADSMNWESARYQWGKTAAEYWQTFLNTANRISDEHSVPLGWAQGLTDKRIYQSAGWAEGMGERPEGSEGWAEGMGRQGKGSQGWAEGYDD